MEGRIATRWKRSKDGRCIRSTKCRAQENREDPVKDTEREWSVGRRKQEPGLSLESREEWVSPHT